MYAMDMFIEKIVRRKKSPLDYALIFLIILAAFVASFFVMAYIPGFALVIMAGLFYLAYFIISKRNIEYEYAVTNGDLDIDVIINQKKRKRLFSSNCKEFEIVARVKSDKYTSEFKDSKNVKDFSSHEERAEVWFISLRTESGSTVVLFEPSEKMIDSFHTFIPRKVFKY